MLQMFVAVGSALVIFVRVSSNPIEWWIFCAIGIVFGMISWISFQINSGIRKNNDVLSKFALEIGDNGIPEMKSKWKTSSHWVVVFIGVLAGSFIVCGLFRGITKLCGN